MSGNLSFCKDYLLAEANLRLSIEGYLNQILTRMEKGEDRYCLSLDDVFMMLLRMSKLMGGVTMTREMLFDRFPDTFINGDDLETTIDHVLTFIEKKKEKTAEPKVSDSCG